MLTNKLCYEIMDFKEINRRNCWNKRLVVEEKCILCVHL